MRRRARGRTAPGAAAVALALWTLATAATAQSLDDLRTPSMPAFTLLDIAPIAIERPGTPQALGIELLSAARQGGLPDSYALEVAPYWLTPKPFLTFDQRYDPSFLQGILQTFALSVATAPMPDEDADSVRLGAGFRVLLLPGRPPPGPAKDSLNAIQQKIVDLSERIDAEDNDVLSAALRVSMDSLAALSEALARDVADEYDDPALGGVRWELAGGIGSLFPRSELANGRITTYGAWTSVSFRPADSRSDLVALARFQHLDLAAVPGGGDVAGADGEQDVIDVGGRVLWATGAFELSGELVGRFAFDASGRAPAAAEIQYGTTYQATAGLKYVVTDRIAVQWALGRGFALEGVDVGNLIADLGLQFGLGPELDLPF